MPSDCDDNEVNEEASDQPREGYGEGIVAGSGRAVSHVAQHHERRVKLLVVTSRKSDDGAECTGQQPYVVWFSRIFPRNDF